MSSRRAALFMSVALTVAGMAVPAHAATHNITVTDNTYDPRTLRIEPGDTVVWTARNTQHTVTADDGSFDFHLDRTLAVGEQVSVTFPDAGTVRYHCKLHGAKDGVGMAGVIRVGSGGGDDIRPQVSVPHDYPTITDALDGVAPGTTVLIHPGAYREEIEISTPDLVLHGLGETPADVVLDGGNRFAAVTVRARGVRIEHLSVRNHNQSGVRIEAGAASLSEVVLDGNNHYGVLAVGQAGLTLHGVTATRHAIAGVAVLGCSSCGARLDDVTVEGNAVGLLAADATGLLIRNAELRGNGAGIVLRHVSAATVSGSTLTDNSATHLRIASAFHSSALWTGAGVWLDGGRDNRVHTNTASGHTYNIVVTGPALGHRITGNTVDGARHADLGWDGPGANVCFSGNRTTNGDAPTSHPSAAQTFYDCALPATVGLPYPVITAHLTAHAQRLQTPELSAEGQDSARR
jgi:plastocyanin